MNLYLISQTINSGYDTYDAAVVAAVDEAAARLLNPGHDPHWERDSWADSPDQVTVEHLGLAAAGINAGVLLASFNAG